MLVSEREQSADAFGPTLVVCPMSVARQWAREIARFAPSLRVHVHHGGERLAGDGVRESRAQCDLVITSYDIATRDIDALARSQWDRLLLDEAQDVKNPATKRARALRRLDARRRAGDDGDADREPARRALGDHGHRQPGPARLARAVRPHLRPPDRGVRRRAGARTASLDGAAVHPSPPEGQPRGRARAAEDHDREGVLPPHARAGEPLPRDGRPLDAAHRGARAQLRPPRRRARDAEPAEAGLQPPGDAPRRRAAARRPIRQARAPRRAARGDAGRATRRSSSRSTPASTGSCRTLHERLGREIGFFHGGLRARQRDELVASFSERRTVPRCS